MDTHQLERLLNNHLSGVFYGACARDELPRFNLRPMALISNLSPSTSEGTHWIAIWLSADNRGEYFDSFGRRPNPHFQMYMDQEADKGWSSNARQLQSKFSTLCGAFCLQYLEARRHTPNIHLVKLLNDLFPYSTPLENDIHVQQRMESHYGIRMPMFDDSLILKRGMGKL